MAKKFKNGDVVSIINSTLGGKAFVEADDASVIRDHGDGWCEVRMTGGVYERYVDLEAQADPHAFVKQINKRLGFPE